MSDECMAVSFTSKAKAELVPLEAPAGPGPDEIMGRTLVTLISAGTELAVYQDQHSASNTWPRWPGYAAVFEVEKIGKDVTGVSLGELRFCMGGHRSVQVQPAGDTLAVPPGLLPEKAVFARMMGVTTTTLATTTARPGDRVMVTGLGPVGLLGALMFKHCGYDVIGVDPDSDRRGLASAHGIEMVLEAVPVEDSSVAGKVALVVECSAHEKAVLDACRVVKRRGEVVLVGVPWKKNTDLTAHDILDAVFHKYVVLRSGWEWELPRHPTHFQERSVWGNLEMAMNWLADGSVKVDGLGMLASPRDSQKVYQDLMYRRTGTLVTLFGWR